jgi:hypothetical protein
VTTSGRTRTCASRCGWPTPRTPPTSWATRWRRASVPTHPAARWARRGRGGSCPSSRPTPAGTAPCRRRRPCGWRTWSSAPAGRGSAWRCPCTCRRRTSGRTSPGSWPPSGPRRSGSGSTLPAGRGSTSWPARSRSSGCSRPPRRPSGSPPGRSRSASVTTPPSSGSSPWASTQSGTGIWRCSARPGRARRRCCAPSSPRSRRARSVTACTCRRSTSPPAGSPPSPRCPASAR